MAYCLNLVTFWLLWADRQNSLLSQFLVGSLEHEASYEYAAPTRNNQHLRDGSMDIPVEVLIDGRSEASEFRPRLLLGWQDMVARYAITKREHDHEIDDDDDDDSAAPAAATDDDDDYDDKDDDDDDNDDDDG